MSTTKANVPAKPVAVKTAPEKAKTETPADETATKKKGEKAREFTYIGAGENSPYVINFMGKQRFTRGQLTEVTDPELLAKLPGIATFVEGPADAETLHKIDTEAKEAADLKRAEDLVVNAKYSKKFRVE